MIDLRDIGFVLNDGPPLSNTYKKRMISDVEMFSQGHKQTKRDFIQDRFRSRQQNSQCGLGTRFGDALTVLKGKGGYLHRQ